MREQLQMTRREMLGVAGAGAVATAFELSADLCAGDDLPLIIDCHAHIYGEDEAKYPPIEKPYRPPAGKGTIAHLQREMRDAGVKFVTAIQTSTFYKFDNRFTTESSRDRKSFMAGVCTLDPDNPASPKQLEEYVKGYNVQGMRSIPAQSGRLDDPGVDALWSTAERLGIVINVLTGVEQQAEIEALAMRHPRLRVVIDHCFALKAGPALEPTLRALRSLAKIPTIHAKLSFVPTGSAEEYPFRDMHVPCHEVIRAFGAERCVWGSDFPCELWCPKVSYAQHLRLFTKELDLDPSALKAILGETARRLWFPTDS